MKKCGHQISPMSAKTALML